MYLLIGNMRIYLCGSQIFMSQHFLQNPHVAAVLVHQRCSCVAQLVGGISLCAFDMAQIAFNNIMDAL